MKKVFALALALVLALGLMLIPSHAEDKDMLARILESGKMVVAMEGVWQPWTYHNDDDELVGFDVEVAKAVAEKLGVEAVFEECPWDSIFAGVDAGRYDIVFNGVDYTEERAEKFAFSAPYAYNYAVLIVRADEEGCDELLMAHFGAPLDDPGAALPLINERSGASFDSLRQILPYACPTDGRGDYRPPMVSALDFSGQNCTELYYEGFEIREGKSALPGLPAA